MISYQMQNHFEQISVFIEVHKMLACEVIRSKYNYFIKFIKKY